MQPAAVAGSLVSWPVTQFDVLCANDSELAELRTAIREFLVADREEFGWEPAVDSWLARWDAGSLPGSATRIVGLTIPTEYGGRGLGHLHRYVVTEELLAHGAPVAAHWFADRQFAPSLLSYGSDEQRREFLPDIAAGRLHAAIGMSEPEGSDLAAVKSRAIRADGGWSLSGTKVWTSGATWRSASSSLPAPARSIPSIGMPVSANFWYRWTHRASPSIRSCRWVANTTSTR